MTIQIDPVLRAIRDLEQAVADLYGWYAEIFDDNTEARDFFRHMQRQEIKHRDLVEFERRLVRGNSSFFQEVQIDEKEIRDVITSIDKHISEGVFNIIDALEFALSVEKSAVESFYKTALVQSNPGVESLMKNLSVADDGHVNRLMSFVSSLSS